MLFQDHNLFPHLTAFENVALWHERDISHSSVERVILPDSFIAVKLQVALAERGIDPTEPPRKSSLYCGPVADAAVELLVPVIDAPLLVVERDAAEAR